MLNIVVITPVYATTTSMQGATPVVHYFTREWVKMGYNVTVFNIVAKYPKLFYWFSKRFQHSLNTFFGSLVPIECPQNEDFQAEGVIVHRRCFRKILPHSLYSKKELQKALKCIIDDCKVSGVPDWFVGHWDNPQLELLTFLKRQFNKPIGIVFHNNEFDFDKKYGRSWPLMLKELDAIGFRSIVGKNDFVTKYGESKRSFIAYSGVSEAFLTAGNEAQKRIQQPIRNFVFVGSLIARKYPSAIITALSQAYPNGDFSITFIGDGAEKSKIEEEHKKMGQLGSLHFTGRIPREEIIQHLKQADVFIMISRSEIFGLVYLEAMALGVIPIGSKNEGIDGVICNGENGFLCEAGNVDELTKVLMTLKDLTNEKLREISMKAKETANAFSDKGVAEKYINSLLIWD